MNSRVVFEATEVRGIGAPGIPIGTLHFTADRDETSSLKDGHCPKLICPAYVYVSKIK